MKRPSFRYDFDGEVIEFSPYKLAELREISVKLDALKASGASGGVLSAISDLVPYMAAAAKRCNPDVTPDRLMTLLDMYNFNEVFKGTITNSYEGNSPEGEALPVQ